MLICDVFVSLGRLAKSIVGGLQLLAVEAETRFTIEEGFPDSVIFLRVFHYTLLNLEKFCTKGCFEKFFRSVLGSRLMKGSKKRTRESWRVRRNHFFDSSNRHLSFARSLIHPICLKARNTLSKCLDVSICYTNSASYTKDDVKLSSEPGFVRIHRIRPKSNNWTWSFKNQIIIGKVL